VGDHWNVEQMQAAARRAGATLTIKKRHESAVTDYIIDKGEVRVTYNMRGVLRLLIYLRGLFVYSEGRPRRELEYSDVRRAMLERALAVCDDPRFLAETLIKRLSANVAHARATYDEAVTSAADTALKLADLLPNSLEPDPREVPTP
jgi:hypothetical protein